MTIFQPKITYLRFVIDKNGLSKNRERIALILNAPIPKDISELRAFLGMVNYYSKFIENFSDKMTPLYNLLKKNVEYKWFDECQTAYEQIREDIISDKVIVHFNLKLHIILTTDAPNNAIAGVLSHRFPNKEVKPIAFVSRSLNKAEKNYSTLKRKFSDNIFCFKIEAISNRK